jgi:hypothetical protein
MKYTINYKRSAYEELLQLPANIARNGVGHQFTPDFHTDFN